MRHGALSVVDPHPQRPAIVMFQEVIGCTVVIVDLTDISSLHEYEYTTVLIECINFVSQFGDFLMRSALAVFRGTKVRRDLLICGLRIIMDTRASLIARTLCS